MIRSKLFSFAKITLRRTMKTRLKFNNFEENSDYFQRIYGLSKRDTLSLLYKHPGIYQTNRSELEESYKLLSETLNLDMTNLSQYPHILQLKSSILANRFESLKEFGFKEVDLDMIAKYVYLTNKTVWQLKVNLFIDSDFNVGESLVQCLNGGDFLDPKIVNEDTKMVKNREKLLSLYYQHKLQLSDEALAKFKTHFAIVKHKSFKRISRCLELLEKELSFDRNVILEHPFLIGADPYNLEKLLFEIKDIFGRDIRKIASTRPIFLMSRWRWIKEIVEMLEKANLSNSSIHSVLMLFALEPETVSKRLEELKSIKDLNVLYEHPQVLRLMYNQNKVLHRLSYLKTINRECPSLNVLAGQADSFEKFVRCATDDSKGRQTLVILSKLLDFPEDDLKTQISRHPNWDDVPLETVKNTFTFLIEAEFTKEVIRDNIFIVLYPFEKIEAKLKEIQSGSLGSLVQLDQLTKTKTLNLCVYLIERDYHFSGDGIWLPQTTTDK